MHTLLDLVPSFIHISDGLHDVHDMPCRTGAIYVVDRGYVDFARRLKAGQVEHRCCVYSTDRSHHCDQTISLEQSG